MFDVDGTAENPKRCLIPVTAAVARVEIAIKGSFLFVVLIRCDLKEGVMGPERRFRGDGGLIEQMLHVGDLPRPYDRECGRGLGGGGEGTYPERNIRQAEERPISCPYSIDTR